MISIQFLYQHQPPGSLHLSYYTSLVSFYQENCCTMTEKKTKNLELISVWHETMSSLVGCITINSIVIIIIKITIKQSFGIFLHFSYIDKNENSETHGIFLLLAN